MDRHSSASTHSEGPASRCTQMAFKREQQRSKRVVGTLYQLRLVYVRRVYGGSCQAIEVQDIHSSIFNDPFDPHISPFRLLNPTPTQRQRCSRQRPLTSSLCQKVVSTASQVSSAISRLFSFNFCTHRCAKGRSHNYCRVRPTIQESSTSCGLP